MIALMNKYICLCFYDTKAISELAPQELAGLGPACAPHDDAINATGRVHLTASLDEPADCRTIRPVNNLPVVSDGPYRNGTQQIGAVFVVQAESLEAAVEIAKKHPGGRLNVFKGGIEVRACESYTV